MGKFIFRLDNGSVIRSGDEGAEMLNPAKAMDRGMLSEAHLLKLQALLCEVHAKLPEEGPLKSISLGSKRSMDSVLEVRPDSLGDVLSYMLPRFASWLSVAFPH